MSRIVSTYKAKRGDTELIAQLAAGATVEDAAKHAGVSSRTVFRRLQDPLFRREMRSVRSQIMTATVGRLADAGSEAAETLRELLDARSENVRHSAARSIIELSQRLSETVELEERVAELEDRIEAQTTGKRSRWHA